jgi:hypothetical protein
MRRSIAISLLMLFSWTLIAPLIAQEPEANLPACCRRNGKHHCMMRMMKQRSGIQKGFSTVSQKCPYCPVGVCAAYSPTYKPEAAAAYYAEAVFYPAPAQRTSAHYRSSFLRSHPKRGPPTPLT